jgi:hypothetical protein
MARLTATVRDWSFPTSFCRTMKFAILGTDYDILHLAEAAQRAQHEIVWVGDVQPTDEADIMRIAPNASNGTADWELLLDRSIADAVLVGRGTAANELRAEQLKRLATEGIALLVVHPVFESVLPYYEVDMVRRETGAVVLHYDPLIGHPILPDAARWVREEHPTIGRIHQISCERRVTVSSREAVLRHLARDCELMAALAGDIRRVTAIGPADAGASFASFQIQLTATAPASLRWSVGYAAVADVGLHLSLLAENGVVTLRVADTPEHGRPAWELETNHAGARTNQKLPDFDPAQAAITLLAETVEQSRAGTTVAASTWDAATRAMEVVDAAELSLQKGRTIEVYQQQLTERLAFRGTMAAIGCGLLLLAFVAVIFVAFISGLNPLGLGPQSSPAGGVQEIPQPRGVPFWSLALLALLAFFLLLQAVPLLARKSSRRQEESQRARTVHRDS